MPDDETLSDLDRRSLRILARSSRNAPAGDRLSSRLERAAETGSRHDYEKAEQTFDSLPPEDRVKISAKAEKQAETERELVLSRKRRATATPPPAKDKGDDTLDWQPIFAAREPADETPAKPAPKTKAPPPPSAKSWDLETVNPKRQAAPTQKEDGGRPPDQTGRFRQRGRGRQGLGLAAHSGGPGHVGRASIR